MPQETKPKRAFLKRGAGTSRFDRGGMASAREQYISLHPSESNAVAAAMSPHEQKEGPAESSTAPRTRTGSHARTPHNEYSSPLQPPSRSAPASSADAEQQSLAEFEELEETVRRQAEDLAAAAGLDPSIEIFVPPAPPAQSATPAHSAPEATTATPVGVVRGGGADSIAGGADGGDAIGEAMMEAWMADYDDEDGDSGAAFQPPPLPPQDPPSLQAAQQPAVPAGFAEEAAGGVAIAPSTVAPLDAEPLVAEQAAAAERGLEPETPSRGSRPAGRSRASRRRRQRRRRRRRRRPRRGRPSAAACGTYSIFNTTNSIGGIGGACRRRGWRRRGG